MSEPKPFPAPIDVPSDDDLVATSPSRRTPPKRRWGRIAIVLIGLSIVAGAAAGGYWYWQHHRQSAKPKTTTAATKPPLTPATATATGTAQYVSNGKDLNLSFTYPAGWSASPTSNNNANDKPITITSPLISLTDASGAAATSKVVVSIRTDTSSMDELADGSATAAQDSAQFAYDKPTASQHQYPYLTFVHLSSNATATSFAEVIITGITNFPKGQAVTAGSLGGLDPVISASFYTCSTETCNGAGATRLSLTASTWQNNPSLKQVQTLFQSLQLN